MNVSIAGLMKRLFELLISLCLLTFFIKYILYTESLLDFILLFFLFMPFASLAIAPLMWFNFIFKFYSKILLVQFPNKKVYDLHLASHFDLISFSRSSKNPKKMIFYEIITGLLKICEEIENKKIPMSVSIRATTFFVGDRSFKKLGFTSIKESKIFFILYLFDYIGILISNYVISKKFTFVNIYHTKKASMTGEDLVRNKANLTRMKNMYETK